jgi:hypothetical protein
MKAHPTDTHRNAAMSGRMPSVASDMVGSGWWSWQLRLQ